MRSPRIQIIIAVVVCLLDRPASSQVPVTYHPDWNEVWSTGYPVRHYNQPIAFVPDCQVPSQCPRWSGYGMGMFRYSDRLYHLFQGNDKSQVYKSATWIGDHVDALIRRDVDGAYERIPDFFALPAFSQLLTQWDPSVSSTPPAPQGGTAWQIGSGFAPIAGPPLSADPPGASRAYYFFAPESEFDGGLGGHLIGFASQATSAPLSAPVPWGTVWRDGTSPNDGAYRLQNGLPLHTLHIGNFTPVLKFRADPSISGVLQSGARVFGGLTGWYEAGWFYLLTNTLLSVDWPQDCSPVTFPTSPALGLVLFRVKHDPVAADTGGLALDSNRRPIVEILASPSAGGPKSFVPVPNSDQPISFSDDGKPWRCSEPNRSDYSGCCTNPPFPASRALIPFPDDPGFIGLPSSVIESANGRDRFVVLSTNSPQAGDYRFRLVRVARTGLASPYLAFGAAGEWSHPNPSGYIVNTNYYAALPNVANLGATTLIGFRTAQDATTGTFGQFAFTADLGANSSRLHTLTPCRVLDTRDLGAPLGGPALAAGERRVFLLGGACSIPSSARAVVFNVTIPAPIQSGSISLAPGDVLTTATTAISFIAGKSRANNGIVSLGGAGSLAITSNLGSGFVHVIVDVNGYFE